MECTRNETVVRDGKGGKDGVTTLPVSLSDRLRAHLAVVKAQHDSHLSLGKGELWLRDALAVKYPSELRRIELNASTHLPAPLQAKPKFPAAPAHKRPAKPHVLPPTPASRPAP